MIATQTVKECIIDPDKTRKIHDVIAASSTQYGMQTFDQSLYNLYQRHLITYEEALQWCTNPDDFALKVKGIQSTSDVAQGTVEKKGEGDSSKFKVERFGK
jgi:twitching motility protein PilT